MKKIKLKESDLTKLVKKIINEQNSQHQSMFLQANDGLSQCQLCQQVYTSKTKRNKYCKCSTCPCTTGQYNSNVACRMCNVVFWSTSLRNKYCKCKTCPCSTGLPTTTNLGVDKDFTGIPEPNNDEVYAKERPNIYDGTDGTKIKLKESDLQKIVKRVIKEQSLPRHIRKGSEEHADWIRSQREKNGDDKANDEILESLLTISQRLERFVKETREDGIPMEDLRDIQKDVEYQIIQYLGATEGRG